METKYILVTFPEIQDFMEHPRFNECIFCMEIEGHPCEGSTYAVPEDLYNSVHNIKSPIILNAEDISVIEESAHFINYIFQTEGEDINTDNLDEKLLSIINR